SAPISPTNTNLEPDHPSGNRELQSRLRDKRLSLSVQRRLGFRQADPSGRREYAIPLIFHGGAIRHARQPVAPVQDPLQGNIKCKIKDLPDEPESRKTASAVGLNKQALKTDSHSPPEGILSCSRAAAG